MAPNYVNDTNEASPISVERTPLLSRSELKVPALTPDAKIKFRSSNRDRLLPKKTKKINTDGGCYFDDGITSVNRSLEGDYAYCGGNGQVCNDTYAGAFSQDNYDPRWRPWYIETRKLQTANWAEPYIYFNSLMGFGTSYCHPIYTTPQEGQADDEKTEFLGVLAIDYTLDNITDTLVKNFDSEVFENTTVAVFEDKPPYFLIGTSEAELRPTICHDNEFDNKCTTKRRKITDLTGSSILSAYSEQKEKSFPEGESIEIKLEKGEGAGYLISRSETFHTADVGAEWRILVVNSANLVGSDTIKPGDSMFALTVAIATIGTVFCSILTYLYLSNRTEREIINSDWRFTGAFLISCILLSASSLCYIGPNSDALCMLRMWLPNLFFVTTLALLFVKNIRMYRLVGRGFSREKISHAKTAAMAVPIVLVQVIMLTICSFVDPSKRTEDIENIRTDSTYRVCCKHKSNTFVFIIYAYEAVLILAGCVVAFKTRNLMEEFGEAKQILLTMYDIALVSSILLFIKLTGAVDEQAMEYVFAVLAIFMATCFSCSVFVLPRWTQIQIRMQATAASTGRVTFGGGAAMEPLIANGERAGI